MEPLKVDVQPSAFSDPKDLATLILTIISIVVAICTLLVTASISAAVWWYDRQQKKRQDQQAEQQRLQGHVTQLSDAGGTAMDIIGRFKEDCESIGEKYYTVYSNRVEVSRCGTAIITRQQLHEVDTARRRLQGIWDNIMDDYRAGLLGAQITDQTHGRMLNRGLSYLELVEPLDAANYTRLQRLRKVVGDQGRYALPAYPPSPPPSALAPSLLNIAPRFVQGGRPARFKWLENQQTIKCINQQLWANEATSDPQYAALNTFRVDAQATRNLDTASVSDHKAFLWKQRLENNWKLLLLASEPVQPAGQAAAAAAGGAAVQLNAQPVVLQPGAAAQPNVAAAAAAQAFQQRGPTGLPGSSNAQP